MAGESGFKESKEGLLERLGCLVFHDSDRIILFRPRVSECLEQNCVRTCSVTDVIGHIY